MINANRLSPAEFAEFVRGSIQTLSEIGIKLSPDFQRTIAQNYELNREGIHHRADPLTAVLRWISERAWTDYLRAESWMHSLVAEAFDLILVQLSFPRVREDEEARGIVSLLQRRYLLACTYWPGATLEEQFEYCDHLMGLPDASKEPALVDIKKVTPGEIEDTFRRIEKLVGRQPIIGKLENQFEVDAEKREAAADADADCRFQDHGGGLRVRRLRKTKTDFGQVGDSCATVALAHATQLDAITRKLLAFVRQPEFVRLHPSQHILTFLLSLFHGIPVGAVTKLGVCRDGEIGRITPTTLYLKIGARCYPQASAYSVSCLPLPLAVEIVQLLKTLSPDWIEAESLEGLWGLGHYLAFRLWFQKFIREAFSGLRISSIAINRVWTKVAVLDLGTNKSVVGLLRGHPLSLDRGPSSYLSASTDEPVATLQQIQEEIRRP